MRSEFEKNRYWIGLFKTDVEFNGSLGEFGRYELNGSRDVNHSYLEAFNGKWEAYAKAWQHRQTEVDEMQKRVDELEEAFKHLIAMNKESISYEHDLFDKGWNQCAETTIRNIYTLTGLEEQALKGENK